MEGQILSTGALPKQQLQPHTPQPWITLTKEFPYLPNELITLIVSYLDQIDLACFRAVNHTTLHLIKLDLRHYTLADWLTPSNTFLQRRILMYSCPNIAGRIILPPYPGLPRVRYSEYTHCIGWQVMCRFERDMNLEKEEQLLCWGCMIKHPRESFLPADDRTPGVEMCRVNARPEERICRFRFADLVFVDARDDPNRGNKAFLDAHWEDLGKRKSGCRDLTVESLKRIISSSGSSRRTRDKAIVVEDTMDLCMLCKLPWKAGKCDSKAGCVPRRVQPDGKRCTLCPSSKIRVPRFWTRTPDQEWVENPKDRPKERGICFQYGSNLKQSVEDKFENVLVAVYDKTGREKRCAAKN